MGYASNAQGPSPYLIKYHSALPRLGPALSRYTLQALPVTKWGTSASYVVCVIAVIDPAVCRCGLLTLLSDPVFSSMG